MRVLLLTLLIAPCLASADTPEQFDAVVKAGEHMMLLATRAQVCGFRSKEWASNIFTALKSASYTSAILTQGSAGSEDQRTKWAMGKIDGAVIAALNPTTDECHELGGNTFLMKLLDEIQHRSE